MAITHFIRRNAARAVAFACVASMMAGCDRTSDVFVAECQKVTHASSSDCSCAASKVKEIIGPEKWKVAGELMSGDRDKAEMTMVKEGVGGMLGFVTQWTVALGVAERQCNVRGLSRM